MATPITQYSLFEKDAWVNGGINVSALTVPTYTADWVPLAHSTLEGSCQSQAFHFQVRCVDDGAPDTAIGFSSCGTLFNVYPVAPGSPSIPSNDATTGPFDTYIGVTFTCGLSSTDSVVKSNSTCATSGGLELDVTTTTPRQLSGGSVNFSETETRKGLCTSTCTQGAVSACRISTGSGTYDAPSTSCGCPRYSYDSAFTNPIASEPSETDVETMAKTTGPGAGISLTFVEASSPICENAGVKLFAACYNGQNLLLPEASCPAKLSVDYLDLVSQDVYGKTIQVNGFTCQKKCGASFDHDCVYTDFNFSGTCAASLTANRSYQKVRQYGTGTTYTDYSNSPVIAGVDNFSAPCNITCDASGNVLTCTVTNSADSMVVNVDAANHCGCPKYSLYKDFTTSSSSEYTAATVKAAVDAGPEPSKQFDFVEDPTASCESFSVQTYVGCVQNSNLVSSSFCQGGPFSGSEVAQDIYEKALIPITVTCTDYCGADFDIECDSSTAGFAPASGANCAISGGFQLQRDFKPTRTHNAPGGFYPNTNLPVDSTPETITGNCSPTCDSAFTVTECKINISSTSSVNVGEANCGCFRYSYYSDLTSPLAQIPSASTVTAAIVNGPDAGKSFTFHEAATPSCTAAGVDVWVRCIRASNPIDSAFCGGSTGLVTATGFDYKLTTPLIATIQCKDNCLAVTDYDHVCTDADFKYDSSTHCDATGPTISRSVQKVRVIGGEDVAFEAPTVEVATKAPCTSTCDSSNVVTSCTSGTFALPTRECGCLVYSWSSTFTSPSATALTVDLDANIEFEFQDKAIDQCDDPNVVQFAACVNGAAVLPPQACDRTALSVDFAPVAGKDYSAKPFPTTIKCAYYCSGVKCKATTPAPCDNDEQEVTFAESIMTRYWGTTNKKTRNYPTAATLPSSHVVEGICTKSCDTSSGSLVSTCDFEGYELFTPTDCDCGVPKFVYSVLPGFDVDSKLDIEPDADYITTNPDAPKTGHTLDDNTACTSATVTLYARCEFDSVAQDASVCASITAPQGGWTQQNDVWTKTIPVTFTCKDYCGAQFDHECMTSGANSDFTVNEAQMDCSSGAVPIISPKVQPKRLIAGSYEDFGPADPKTIPAGSCEQTCTQCFTATDCQVVVDDYSIPISDDSKCNSSCDCQIAYVVGNVSTAVPAKYDPDGINPDTLTVWTVDAADLAQPYQPACNDFKITRSVVGDEFEWDELQCTSYDGVTDNVTKTWAASPCAAYLQTEHTITDKDCSITQVCDACSTLGSNSTCTVPVSGADFDISTLGFSECPTNESCACTEFRCAKPGQPHSPSDPLCSTVQIPADTACYTDLKLTDVYDITCGYLDSGTFTPRACPTSAEVVEEYDDLVEKILPKRCAFKCKAKIEPEGGPVYLDCDATNFRPTGSYCAVWDPSATREQVCVDTGDSSELPDLSNCGTPSPDPANYPALDCTSYCHIGDYDAGDSPQFPSAGNDIELCSSKTIPQHATCAEEEVTRQVVCAYLDLTRNELFIDSTHACDDVDQSQDKFTYPFDQSVCTYDWLCVGSDVTTPTFGDYKACGDFASFCSASKCEPEIEVKPACIVSTNIDGDVPGNGDQVQTVAGGCTGVAPQEYTCACDDDIWCLYGAPTATYQVCPTVGQPDYHQSFTVAACGEYALRSPLSKTKTGDYIGCVGDDCGDDQKLPTAAQIQTVCRIDASCSTTAASAWHTCTDADFVCEPDGEPCGAPSTRDVECTWVDGADLDKVAPLTELIATLDASADAGLIAALEAACPTGVDIPAATKPCECTVKYLCQKTATQPLELTDLDECSPDSTLLDTCGEGYCSARSGIQYPNIVCRNATGHLTLVDDATEATAAGCSDALPTCTGLVPCTEHIVCDSNPSENFNTITVPELPGAEAVCDDPFEDVCYASTDVNFDEQQCTDEAGVVYIKARAVGCFVVDDNDDFVTEEDKRGTLCTNIDTSKTQPDCQDYSDCSPYITNVVVDTSTTLTDRDNADVTWEFRGPSDTTSTVTIDWAYNISTKNWLSLISEPQLATSELYSVTLPRLDRTIATSIVIRVVFSVANTLISPPFTLARRDSCAEGDLVCSAVNSRCVDPDSETTGAYAGVATCQCTPPSITANNAFTSDTNSLVCDRTQGCDSATTPQCQNGGYLAYDSSITSTMANQFQCSAVCTCPGGQNPAQNCASCPASDTCIAAQGQVRTADEIAADQACGCKKCFPGYTGSTCALCERFAHFIIPTVSTQISPFWGASPPAAAKAKWIADVLNHVSNLVGFSVEFVKYSEHTSISGTAFTFVLRLSGPCPTSAFSMLQTPTDVNAVGAGWLANVRSDALKQSAAVIQGMADTSETIIVSGVSNAATCASDNSCPTYLPAFSCTDYPTHPSCQETTEPEPESDGGNEGSSSNSTTVIIAVVVSVVGVLLIALVIVLVVCFCGKGNSDDSQATSDTPLKEKTQKSPRAKSKPMDIGNDHLELI